MQAPELYKQFRSNLLQRIHSKSQASTLLKAPLFSRLPLTAMFPCREGCCQGGADVPAEVILEDKRPQAPHFPVPDDNNPLVADDAGKVTLEISYSEELGSIEEVSNDISPARSLSIKRMSELRHMEVDFNITRGIPLHRALRHTELWTSPHEIKRKNRSAQVWNRSTRVSSYDIFLSHTWRTKGRWKRLALTLQTGWLHGLFAWCLGLTIMLSLRGFDILSDPWKNDLFFAGQRLEAPFTPWTIIVAELALMIGLALSPYLPFKTVMCFLDVACIHQGQHDLFERGIYGIGGCLSVTQELRILYTPEYLSSLWCVFELSGFRKVRPGGKLCVSPLFIERSTVNGALMMCCGHLSLQAVIANVKFAASEDSLAAPALATFSAITLTVIIFVVHSTRLNYRDKRRLISDLSTFDVDNLFCASDFDRAFILSAIEAWHGSREAFNTFVRSDLRQELLSLLPSPHLPPKYAALLLSSQMAWMLDMCMSFYKAGYDIQDVSRWAVVSFAFYGFWFWFAFNSIFYLSDRSAPAAHTCLLDWLKTLAVTLAILLWLLIGFVLWRVTIRSTGAVELGCFVAFCMLLPCLILDVFPSRELCR